MWTKPFLLLFDTCSYISFYKKVPDGLEQWRLGHAVPRLLGIMEDHRTLMAVTEQVECRRAANASPPFGPHSQAKCFIGTWENV